MGLGGWLSERKLAATTRTAERRRQNEHRRTSQDPAVIASQVPELAGMTDVQGMAYTLEQVRNWRASVPVELGAELDQRLRDSQKGFTDIGLVMPYWGNLWVLRTYQRSLGLNVPEVAPVVGSGAEQLTG